MSSLKCSFCGYGIHYHGEPEGTEPVEHYFCTLDKWKKLEKENLPADSIEIEHEYPFIESWRCARCGSFIFFKNGIKVAEVYTPNENFSSEPMKEPFEFGPFWNDFQWFDITEDDVTAAEVLKKYPGNSWFKKNDDELRFYTDEACTNCVAQFRRLQVVTPITVKTMSLAAFKKMLANCDDVQFRYKSELYNYNFIRESDGINIYHGLSNERIVYHADTFDVEDVVNAKIFDDKKSIAQVQAEVEQ